MADPLIGKTIGQYQIVELAGQGGMATVYKAYQPSLNRYVALKVLPEYLAHDDEFVKRFKQEATAAAALRHPNIIVIYDIGEAGSVHYIATEFLEGQTLDAVLKQSGALPLPRVVKIVAQLTSALEAAHQQNLIHRDVKPSNVFLNAKDHVTLMDFGIVKAVSSTRLTRTGLLVGTPEYMSPEQAEGQALDGRSDLYSLGVVVYQMLTGQTPFTAPTPNAVLYAHVNRPPTPLSRLNQAVPQSVEAVVLRALAKKPADRFQSVAEFATALEQAASQASASLAAGLYRDARQLAAQGKAAEAQVRLDQLRQLSPTYPGLADLSAQVARQAQVEREYREVVTLARQARERAADFARRAPGHPDPEHVLRLSAASPASSRGAGWAALWLAGSALAIGALLGFWAVPKEGRWAWGAPVLFSNLLGDAVIAPWAAFLALILAVGAGALARLLRHRVISRVLGFGGGAVMLLCLLLTVILDQRMGIEGPGPTLLLAAQLMLVVGLIADAWRGV
jgi:hypothetical protein